MAERSPLVSVLMPVYNCEHYIDEAVASILNQTFTNFEFLIIDDASADQTFTRLQSFDDPRIILTRNVSNKGLAQNLNDLLRVAKGEFIARMDGDDVSFPERFALQVAYLDSHPACGVVGSRYLWMDEEGRDTRFFEMPEDDAAIRGGLIYHCNTIIHATTMMRKSVLDQVGGYRPRIGITEDYDLWLRMKDVCEFANIPRVLYRYRQHRTQVGTARRREQNAVALMARLYALERRRLGRDSLDLFSDDDIVQIRKGSFLPPRTGSSRDQQAILSDLVMVLNRALMPREAFMVSMVILRKWPFCIAGYKALGFLAISPRTYIRVLKTVRNSIGRVVRKVFGDS